MESINGLAQLGGTVSTVVLFLYYLNKKDEGFNKIVNNHLVHSNKIIKDNSKALNKVSINLKELSMKIVKNTIEVKKSNT